MKSTLILTALGLALGLAGCDGGNGNRENPGAPTGRVALSNLMTSLFNGPLVGTPNTGERSLPVDINALEIDASSEDPAQFRALLM